MEITSLSSRGQVVIPQSIRDNLHLHIGEKFIVMGKNDIVILKKIGTPSFRDFDDLLKKTRESVKKKGIKTSDVDEAIKRAG